MGKFYSEISPKQSEFIKKQRVFFVASAPLSAEGTVNVSPKGYDAFRQIDENTVAYLDLCGSGVETISHMKEKNNGRITFMFCAFEGPPLILRLYCRGTVHEKGTAGFDQYKGLFPAYVSEANNTRSIIVGKVYQTQDSCGYAVPFMEFKEERPTLLEKAKVKSEGDFEKQPYIGWNAWSIDGLPGRGSTENWEKQRKESPFQPKWHMQGPRREPNTFMVVGVAACIGALGVLAASWALASSM